jgi:hypothetical protein
MLDLSDNVERTAQRVKLPLVECAHEAQPGKELTPERVADVLLEKDAGRHVPPDLGNAYREMASDERREAKAHEWAEALIGDVADETR